MKVKISPLGKEILRTPHLSEIFMKFCQATEEDKKNFCLYRDEKGVLQMVYKKSQL